jgi:hypothetical protein
MAKVLSFLLFIPALLGLAAEPKPGNIAPLAKASASSSRPEYPLVGVNDSRMDTQWSTALGQTTGQWLQLDWAEPHEICGVVLCATGPWTQSIDVQANYEGASVSVGHGGSVDEKVPVHALIELKRVRTKSLRFLFEGGAAYHEVEVYEDPARFAACLAEATRVQILAAGDLRGHLLGTVSQDNGAVAIQEAAVSVTGTTPNGSWQESGKTGANGEFEVPLPFATTGQIQVAVSKSEVQSKSSFDSQDIATQLTPPLARAQKYRLSLEGQWQFTVDPPKGFPAGSEGLNWTPIRVPAHWEMEGFSAESGRAAYRKSFTLPASWKGKRIKLRAEAVYSRAELWVNGHRVGSHEGGFTPFELDITEQARIGRGNELLMLVDARSMASEIDNASFFAYFELAGIWQPIEVFADPASYISHLAVNAQFDSAWRDAELAVELDVVNETALGNDTELELRLLDPEGKEVGVSGLRSRVSLGPWDRKTLTLKAAIPAPKTWNAEQPRLYKLVAELPNRAGDNSRLEQSFGFRQIAIKGRTLTLNGQPVKIRGISRLDAHPLLGRALTPEVDRQDMRLIKEANFNMVRATIAPPHPAALDAGDHLGLYFENEGPTCWGNHASDLRYAAIYQGIMCQYLERDRNHPCVFDWSLCNESDYGRVFSMAAQKMRRLDPTRVYSATWGDESLDLEVFHHPISLPRIRDSLNGPKPVFFDEVSGVFHGWMDLALFQDIDPGMGDYWIEGLPEIHRALNAGENQVGAVQFSWVDDAFLVPGKSIGCWRREQPPIRYTESVYLLPQRGLMGDVAWGTVDGWRRPRPEYWLSKKLYSPVHIEEVPLALPEAGQPIVVSLENWNQFVDLNQYPCRWELGGQKGEARAQAPPMHLGSLHIDVRRSPGFEDTLVLRFYDPRGWLVDAYRLAFKPHETPRFPNSGRAARILEHGGYLDNASAVRLLGPKVELAYDRTSGELFRALVDRQIILTLGPKLHLQKTRAPTADYPLGSAGKLGLAIAKEDVPGDSVWHFATADYRTESNQAVLRWTGNYGRDLEGGFEIRMDDAGNAEFRYEFTNRVPDLWVREIGLEFELPLAFCRLNWDRRAEYSYYPEDHIGRPVGEALAHPDVAQMIPPGARPYGLDDHPLGCNDFRSTKRHIYTASLTNKSGRGIQVVSDGSQHVRASVGMHEIKLRVLDYYGGTAWTYREGFHYGPGRKITAGEVLRGTVRLQLDFHLRSGTPQTNSGR